MRLCPSAWSNRTESSYTNGLWIQAERRETDGRSRAVYVDHWGGGCRMLMR